MALDASTASLPQIFTDYVTITDIYVVPVIFFFGIMGNCLSFYVFKGLRYAESTMAFFMRYLAVCDSSTF